MLVPPKQQQPEYDVDQSRTFSSDTGIEADEDDDQYIRPRILPKSVNQMGPEKIRQLQLQQFQQKQRQLEAQHQEQRSQYKPLDNNKQPKQQIRVQAGSSHAELADLISIRNLRSKFNIQNPNLMDRTNFQANRPKTARGTRPGSQEKFDSVPEKSIRSGSLQPQPGRVVNTNMRNGTRPSLPVNSRPPIRTILSNTNRGNLPPKKVHFNARSEFN